MTNRDLIQQKRTFLLMLTCLLVVFVTVSGFVWNGGFKTKKIETKRVPIPVAIQYEREDTLPKGIEEVVQEGAEGLDEVEEEVVYAAGNVVESHELSRNNISPMKPKVIRTGTLDTGSAPSHGQVKQMITMEATAYLPTDGGGDGITATGVQAHHGIVAVDPNVIPLGTRLYIPGYGEAVAADTGGDIIGNRIDVVLEDYSSAIQFGRRTVEVYVLS